VTTEDTVRLLTGEAKAIDEIAQRLGELHAQNVPWRDATAALLREGLMSVSGRKD
jgi:hypothetical protein